MNHVLLLLLATLAICCVHAQNSSPSPISGKCHANEVMRVCKTACEATCSNPEPGICNQRPARICRRGCQCAPGYVRDEETQRCVCLEDCSTLSLQNNA